LVEVFEISHTVFDKSVIIKSFIGLLRCCCANKTLLTKTALEKLRHMSTPKRYSKISYLKFKFKF